MGRLRPPAAPATLPILFPVLLLLVLLQSFCCACSLRTGDVHPPDAAALDRFRKGMDMDLYKSTWGNLPAEQPGALHPQTALDSRLRIHRVLLQGSGKDKVKANKLPGRNNVPGSPSNATPPGNPPRSPGPSNDTPPGNLPRYSESSERKKWHIWLIVVLGVVAGLALGLALCLRHKKVKAVKPWKTGLSGQLTKALVNGAQPLKRADVETACESFSNIVGSLSDATIYKGTLSNGVEIAVSVIKANRPWPPQDKTQFKNKVALLSKFNHKNFVNLIGYCEENKPFSRMLIFEYAPNGTLFEHLHIRESQDLSWASRLRIAMGVAYCLQHMHHQQTPPLILKNLDSNVIYLTDDFAAKIADMELWSKTAEGTTSSVTGPSEALQHEIPDKESIVHKFGIVLLELLSGRPPYSDKNHGLVSWASEYLNGGRPLKEIIDPVLNKVGEEDVKPFFEVIKDCLRPNPRERPLMNEVVAKLRIITGISPEGAAPKLSPLWWAELEIISMEAT